MSIKRLIAFVIAVPVMTVASLSGVSQAAGTSSPAAYQVQSSTSVGALPAFVPPAAPAGDASTSSVLVWKKIAQAAGQGLVAGAVGAGVAALFVANRASSAPQVPEVAGFDQGDAAFDAAS